jgi:hypothetical protein
LKESKNLPPKDTKLVKEYVGRIIGIDENVLHKILHLSITEISVGGEVSNDFNSGSYFKGGASSFEKS